MSYVFPGIAALHALPMPTNSARVVVSAILFMALLLAHVPDAIAKSGGYRSGEKPALAALYESLAPKLVRGGTFIYVRVFSSISNTNPDAPEVWADCGPGALISEPGQKQAAQINGALKSLPVTISYAQTSSSCLPMNSITYLLSGISTTLMQTEDFSPSNSPERQKLNSGVLASLIRAQFSFAQVNATKLIVGTQMPRNIAPHPVLADLAPGDSAIFVESASGELELLARLTPKQWAEMAQYWKRINSPVRKR